MPAARFVSPFQLTGATAFSQTPELLDPVWIVKTFRATKWASRLVEDELVVERRTANPGGWGRRRQPGSWPAMALAFTISDSVDLQPWLAATSTELWKAAGFADKPTYGTVRKRFLDLEANVEHFLPAVAALIQHARKHDDNIGRHVHVDGTEAETHAALVHDCPAHLTCMQRTPGYNRGRAKAGEAMQPLRESTDRARSDRHNAVEADEDDAPELNMSGVDDAKVVDGIARFEINGHWYRSLDATAGIRAYKGPRGSTRFWHGFYNQKAVDHYTGATLAVTLDSASRQEYHLYPELYEQLEQNLGRRPDTVTADKGFAVKSVYEHNTRRGIATVISRKRTVGNPQHHDQDTHDRHGVPRCKHCGGPTSFVRFAHRPSPRLRVDCAVGLTPACAKTQSLSCSKDWRQLIPLWRTNPLYHELKHSHAHYEKAHNNWRSRYRVAADDLGIRPKRRGAGWQRLRATCGLIAEWLRICHREGWLGSARTNRRSKIERPVDWETAGIEAADSLAGFRQHISLTAPYGPAAHALNSRWSPDPPSRVWAAERQAERERERLKQAAQTPKGNKAAKRRGKAKKPEPPPPPPPEASSIDLDDLPF